MMSDTLFLRIVPFVCCRCTALVIPVYLDAATIVLGAIHSRIRKALGKTSDKVTPAACFRSLRELGLSWAGT